MRLRLLAKALCQRCVLDTHQVGVGSIEGLFRLLAKDDEEIEAVCVFHGREDIEGHLE